MKKNFLLLLFVHGIISATSAQKITYGVSAGVAQFNMRGDAVNSFRQLLDVANGIIDTKPVTGFYAGGYTNIPVGGNLVIEPGLYYSAKGYAINGSYSVKDISFLTANANAKLYANYIDLPVLLKADFNGFQVFAGPQVSYLVNADIKTAASVAGINLFSSNTDVTSRFNRWDAGVTAGVGYQFANGFSLKASYDRGLSKVDASKNTQVYNQGFRVGAAFNF